MSLLQEIFGKENGITYDDILRLRGYQESAYIECKLWSVPSNETQKKNQVEDLVIKPLCAFLNREDKGNGLLMLGVKASNGLIEEPVPFEKNDISSGQIRNYISDRISSIGVEINSFARNVIEIEAPGNKQLILVEVERKDPTVYYYSKIRNTAYVREGDASKEMSIGELFTRVEAKRSAKLYVILKIVALESPNYRIDVILKNEGNLPGRNVTLFLHLRQNGSKPPCTKVLKISGFHAGQKVNKEDIETFVAITGNAPKNPIYPKPYSQTIGRLEINLDNRCSMILAISIFEEKGRMSQVFVLEEATHKITENKADRKYQIWS